MSFLVVAALIAGKMDLTCDLRHTARHGASEVAQRAGLWGGPWTKGPTPVATGWGANPMPDTTSGRGLVFSHGCQPRPAALRGAYAARGTWRKRVSRAPRRARLCASGRARGRQVGTTAAASGPSGGTHDLRGNGWRELLRGWGQACRTGSVSSVGGRRGSGASRASPPGAKATLPVGWQPAHMWAPTEACRSGMVSSLAGSGKPKLAQAELQGGALYPQAHCRAVRPPQHPPRLLQHG